MEEMYVCFFYWSLSDVEMCTNFLLDICWNDSKSLDTKWMKILYLRIRDRLSGQNTTLSIHVITKASDWIGKVWSYLIYSVIDFVFILLLFCYFCWLYMFSHASNLVYSLEYEQPVLGANEPPKWNNKLEQAANWILPHPSSHPVASFASQSSSTQEKNNAKPSKTGCNLSIKAIFAQYTQQICLWQCTGQGLDHDASDVRLTRSAFGWSLPWISWGWHPAWKTETASKLCV